MNGGDFKIDMRPPTRQTRLAAFFVLHGIDRSDVAERLGVSRQMLSKICMRETAPAHHLRAMRAMGFPPHLLPRPSVHGQAV